MSNKVIVNGVDMIELIEHNIPKKPLKYEYGGYQCPNCKGLDVQLYNSDGSEKNLNYCNDCGQRLDWSNE